MSVMGVSVTCPECHGTRERRCSTCIAYPGKRYYGKDVNGDDYFGECQDCDGMVWIPCDTCNGRGTILAESPEAPISDSSRNIFRLTERYGFHRPLSAVERAELEGRPVLRADPDPAIRPERIGRRWSMAESPAVPYDGFLASAEQIRLLERGLRSQDALIAAGSNPLSSILVMVASARGMSQEKIEDAALVGVPLWAMLSAHGGPRQAEEIVAMMRNGTYTPPPEPPSKPPRAPETSLNEPVAIVKVADFRDKHAAVGHTAKHAKGVVPRDKGKYELKSSTKPGVPKGTPDIPELAHERASKYVDAAREFMSAEPYGRPGTWEFIRPSDHALVRFDPATGMLGIKLPNGTIKTFMRPDDGVAYFWEQYAKP